MSDSHEAELLKNFAAATSDGEKLALGARLAEHCFIDGLIQGRRVFSDQILRQINESFVGTDAESVYAGFLSRMFSLCRSGDVKSYAWEAGHYVFVHRDHAGKLEADLTNATGALSRMHNTLDRVDQALLPAGSASTESAKNISEELSPDRRIDNSEGLMAQRSAAKARLDSTLQRLEHYKSSSDPDSQKARGTGSPSSTTEHRTPPDTQRHGSLLRLIRKALVPIAAIAALSLLIKLPSALDQFSNMQRLQQYAEQRPGLRDLCQRQSRDIETAGAALDMRQQRLAESQQRIDRLGRELESRRALVATQSEVAIQQYNQELDEYGRTVHEQNLAMRDVQSRVEAHNKRVNSFNASCAGVQGTSQVSGP